MIDKILLSALSTRSRYKALRKSVPDEAVGTQTAWLLTAFGKFFDNNPKADKVDFDVLATMVKLKADKDTVGPVLKMIEAASKAKATDAQILDVTKTLTEMTYSGEIARLINEYNDGAEIDLSYEIYRQTMVARTTLGTSAESMFEEPDIHAILAEQALDHGLKFRQLALQEHIKGLTPPMSIAVCAPVDAGKTSFLADVLTFMAPQCEKLYPGRPILWLSNEGTVREVWPRVYSAALGKDARALAKMTAKQLYDAYGKALGGDKGKIKLKDVHGWSLAQVAGLVEEMNPIIVVFDMLANFKMAGVEKKHEKMEGLFQEVREMGAMHGFIAISTVQISAEGYDQLYPPLTALKDTKIGVQGALDIQLMIGRLNDPAQAGLRGFSTPKNKRKVVGKSGYLQAQVIFNADIARFEDG